MKASRVRRAIGAAVVGAVVGVATLTGVGPDAGAQVIGPIAPGTYKMTLRTGELAIAGVSAPFVEGRLPQCSDGIENDLAYDDAVDPNHLTPLVPPFDNKIDFPADTQCTSAADDSELVAGLQPYIDVSLTGTISATGAISVPVAGVVFPPAYGYAKGIGGSGAFVDVLTVKTVAAVAATGQVNPNGSVTLLMPLRFKIEGGSGLTSLGASCFIGGSTATTAIRLNTTTGNSTPPASPPAGWASITGEKYNNETHRFTVVGNDFAVPGASGCGLFGAANGLINDTAGLPLAAGVSSVHFTFEVTPVFTPAIVANLSAAPASGATPLSTTLNAGASTSIKPIASYAFDADGDDVVDASGPSPTLPWTYTEPGSYEASVTVTDVDGDSATKALTITVVNVAPVAQPQSVSTIHDHATAITLAATDANGDAITYEASPPAHGTLTGTAPDLTYTPDAGYVGSDSFEFSATDTHDATGTSTVSIDVTNLAPVADGQSTSTLHDHAVAITLTGSDADGDAVTLAVTSSPSHGTLSGTAPDVTYTPDAGYVGSDSFGFSASDGLESGDATVSIDVTNQAPVADSQSVSTGHDEPVDITLTGSDADGDTLAYAISSSPAHGTLSGTAPNVTYTPDTAYVGFDSFEFTVFDGAATTTGTINLGIDNQPPTADDQSVSTIHDRSVDVTLTGSDADGDDLAFTVSAAPLHGSVTGTGADVTYTPDAAYVGSDSFQFTADDGAGGSATATVTVDVTNQAPSADGQSLSTSHNVAIPVTLTGSDPDADALAFAVTTAPTHGTLSGTGAALTYTPTTGYVGADSFVFTVFDGVATSSATVNIAMTNQAPTATALSVSTLKNVAVGVTLVGGDADGDAVTYSIVTAPTHGTLTGTGTNRTYTPTTGYTGTDSLVFGVNDGNATTTATVSITVVPPTVTTLTATTAVVNVSLFNGLSLQVGSMSATLRSSAGTPLAGKAITFTAGSSTLCVGTTNASGVATCSGIAPTLLTVLSLGYKATFPGDPAYTASTVNGPVVKVSIGL